jgi:hypothetical protein
MRQDQFKIHLSIEGVDYGEWDKCTGGESQANEIKYRPGGMQPEISLGGTVSVSDIIVERLYDISRDGANLNKFLAGNGRALCSVSRQPLDLNGHAVGTAIVWTGILKNVKLPDADGENNAAALVSLTISPNGVISA